MNLTSITISVPVKSIHEASRWYERCLELKGHIDPAPGIREYELRPDCWLQLSEGESARSEHCLLLGVTDLAGERERLTSLGVDVSEIQRVEGAVAFAEIKDPDGNNQSYFLRPRAGTHWRPR